MSKKKMAEEIEADRQSGAKDLDLIFVATNLTLHLVVSNDRNVFFTRGAHGYGVFKGIFRVMSCANQSTGIVRCYLESVVPP